MDKTTINGSPISDLQESFNKDDLVALMKVTRLIELAPALDDQQYAVFLNALMHYSIKVVGWVESKVAQPVEQTRALTDDDTQAAGLIAQHHRDSAELRKLCEARDQARRSAEYWKAEHLAGNDQIARLTRAMGAFGMLVAACNRLWAEAEEIETADGLAQVALQQYWEAFIEARDNAYNALIAARPASGETE